MTSLVTSDEETPVCGHGYMVPIGKEYCFMPAADGVVTALVKWASSDDADDPIGSFVYAPSEEHAAQLLALLEGRMGNAIHELVEQGKLVPSHPSIIASRRLYRIDDRRLDYLWTYLVSLDRHTAGLTLLPNTVYHYLGPDKSAHRYPRFEDFEAVVALMDQPNALFIRDAYDIPDGTSLGDEVVKSRWDMNDRVVVWDLGSIERTGRARRQN
ncbi:MAG: hypothetical protein JWN38_508 [Candidatus Saccharibacteria bacterium]|nr:hypothetical protein [Candidatus Saccharibacteria bacterium]